MLLLTEVRPVFEFPFLVPLSVPGPRLGGHIPLVTTSPQAPLGCDSVSDGTRFRWARFFPQRRGRQDPGLGAGRVSYLLPVDGRGSSARGSTCARTYRCVRRTHALTRVPVRRRGPGSSSRRPPIPGPPGSPPLRGGTPGSGRRQHSARQRSPRPRVNVKPQPYGEPIRGRCRSRRGRSRLLRALTIAAVCAFSSPRVLPQSASGRVAPRFLSRSPLRGHTRRSAGCPTLFPAALLTRGVLGLSRTEGSACVSLH